MIKLEDGIALPPDVGTGKFPFDVMEPGQSFLIPVAPGEDMNKRFNSVKGNCAYYSKSKDRGREGKLFECRIREDEDGIRVWRTDSAEREEPPVAEPAPMEGGLDLAAEEPKEDLDLE